MQLSESVLHNLLLESLRLKPVSAQGTGRIMKRSVVVDVGERTAEFAGYCRVVIPEGQAVNCAFYSLHTSRKLWGDDALQFKPSRWNHTSAKEREDSCHFLPLSTGTRNCVGRNLAMLELRLAVRFFLEEFRFEFDPADGSSDLQVEEECGINLFARNGLLMRAVPRG